MKNFVSAFYLSCVQLPVKTDKAYQTLTQLTGALLSAVYNYIFFLWSFRDPLSFLVRTCETSVERCFNGEVTFAWSDNTSICRLQNIPGSKEQLRAIFFEQKKAKQITKYTTARGKSKKTHQFFIRDLLLTITHILYLQYLFYFSHQHVKKFSEKEESGQNSSHLQDGMPMKGPFVTYCDKNWYQSFEFDSFRDGILS